MPNHTDVLKDGSKKQSEHYLQFQRLSKRLKERAYASGDAKFLAANFAILLDSLVELKRIDFDMQAALVQHMAEENQIADPNSGNGGHDEEAGIDDPRHNEGAIQHPRVSAQELRRQTYEVVKAQADKLASEALGKSGTPPAPPVAAPEGAPAAAPVTATPADQRPATFADAFDAFKAIGTAILDAPPASQSVTGEEVVHAEALVNEEIVGHIPSGFISSAISTAPAAGQTIDVNVNVSSPVVVNPNGANPSGNPGRPGRRQQVR